MKINLLEYIHTIKDFPKEGSYFKDIQPLLADTVAFKHLKLLISLLLNFLQVGKQLRLSMIAKKTTDLHLSLFKIS